MVARAEGSLSVLLADEEDPEDIERKFWKSLRPTMDAPVYGADIVVRTAAAFEGVCRARLTCIARARYSETQTPCRGT